MNREEKTQAVAAIENVYKNNSAVFVTHYHGLAVSDISNLRKNLSEHGAKFKVVKNTLAKIAAKNTGNDEVSDFFKGPVAVVYSDDPVSAAKVISSFAKKKEVLKIVGGIMNDNVIDHNTVSQLAELPSMDELRGKIVGLINAPAGKIARLLVTPAERLARVINEKSKN